MPRKNSKKSTVLNQQNRKFHFSEIEENKVTRAAEIVGKTKDDFIKYATLYYIDSVMNKSNKVPKTHQYTVQSDARVKDVVLRMMTHNETVCEWYERIYITPYSIKHFIIENKADMGFASINHNVLVRNVDLLKNMIEEHHVKYDLKTGHNGRASIEKAKINRQNNIAEGKNV